MISVDITKRLGSFLLDAQLEAPEGITAVFGPSGSGKSSLINAVAGLLRPDGGTITIEGRQVFDAKAKVDLRPAERRIGYVFQDGRLFPHMTVAKNLRYGGQHDEERVIDLLGLSKLLTRMPGSLSGGEKQRVALGRALMSSPDLLLLDEPLSALDAARKSEIFPYLERLRDTTQTPMIYVSHDISEVARLATTLCLMDAGRIVASGPIGKVLANPALIPQLGVRSAGAVLNCTIAGRLKDDGLTELVFSGGRVLLPGAIGTLGEKVRLRIPAQDVILSTQAPKGLSALNVLPVTITQLTAGKGPGIAVGLRAGQDDLLARVTRRSAGRMGLEVGQQIYAIIKATAVGPRDVGGQP